MQFFMTILVSTPIWVWFLMAGLAWLGLSRTKTRESSAFALLISPVIFGGVVVLKLVLSGFAAMTLFGTASGIVLGLSTIMWLRLGRDAKHLPDGRVRIQGEWISISVIALVFAANYGAAITASIAPHIISTPPAQYGIALINAFSAALMAGRTIAYLRSTQNHMTLPLLTNLKQES